MIPVYCVCTKRKTLLFILSTNDNSTKYEYNKIDRQISVTDADDQVTTYEYDRADNLLSLTDAEDNTTTYTYDGANRLISDTNQLGHTRTYQYDRVGNTILIEDRNDLVQTFTYDSLNRQTQEIWLDSSGDEIHTIEYTYDQGSRLTSVSDNYSSYTYGYDEADHEVPLLVID